MLSTLVPERREITRPIAQRISALTATFREVGALQQNYYICRPRRHALAIVARDAGKAGKAAVAMEVAATTGAATTATVIHDHTEEITTKVTTTIGEIEVAHIIGPRGTEEDEAHGAMAPPLQAHVTVIGS